MSGRSPMRMLAGVVMLAIVYAFAYQAGIVQSFTTAMGASDPGKLTLPMLADKPAVRADRPETVTAAITSLENLRVAGNASSSGYSREQFGDGWVDVDGNGCDTRNDILARDLTEIIYSGGGTCKVSTGTLADPYTATTIAFSRGANTSSAVQIDHVVALSDAWRKGAQSLSVERRTALANDPLNLHAVGGPTNGSKGDSDAAAWLPPNVADRCEYVTTQVQVKEAYNLWVTKAEKSAMSNVLEAC